MAASRKNFFAAHLLGAFLIGSLSALQCLDEGNNKVDWFVAYKMPKLKTSPNKMVRDGVAYFILTSADESRGWVLSSKSILDGDSALGYTLAPFYSNKTGLWLMYNDQPPETHQEPTFGHTKGVVGASEESGFWLVHSVPHFPSNSETAYSYPSTGVHFGKDILMYNEPYVFKFRAQEDLKQKYPELTLVGNGQVVNGPPWFKKSQLTTMGNLALSVYAKSKHFGKDLYEWVATDIQDNLSVETWRNENSKLPSSCDNPFKVFNVEEINLKGVNFSYTHDHSKWAASSTSKMICVGDINRDVSYEGCTYGF